MIKSHKLPDDIMSRLPEAGSYLDSLPEVVFAYLFGSLARDKPAPLSDVDIALYLSEPCDPAEQKLRILGDLMRILETDEIDLILLNTSSLPLKARIVAQKRILTDKDPFLRHRFESLVLREYFDFSIRETDILSRRYGLGR